MKKKILFTLLILYPVTLSFIPLNAGNIIQKETFIFSVKNNDTLRLDKYDIARTEARPCVIFMFGGGFFSGTRDHETYIPYYEFLVNEGFSVVAIDYRLNFKDFKPEENFKAKDFIAVFKETIFMAVEDLFDATNFILEQAPAWNIDKGMIVASGSSAGAIAVLQGEYERCNRTEVAQKLPEDFKYAGVVSFAGAIFSDHGNLKWKNTPAPLQLFHGDADKNVPYDKIKLFRLGFFGSKYIAGKYSKNKYPYYFYMEENADHRLAGSPMYDNLEEIKSFLDKYVKENQPLTTDTHVKSLDKPDVKKKFKIKDYIKSNFGG